MLADGKHIPVGIFEPSNFVAALGTAGKMPGLQFTSLR
jgi:hypothetical protein